MKLFLPSKKLLKLQKKKIDNKDIIKNDIHNLLKRIFDKNNIESTQNVIIFENLVKFPKLLC